MWRSSGAGDWNRIKIRIKGKGHQPAPLDFIQLPRNGRIQISDCIVTFLRSELTETGGNVIFHAQWGPNSKVITASPEYRAGGLFVLLQLGKESVWVRCDRPQGESKEVLM
jgi:hypothetical protein